MDEEVHLWAGEEDTGTMKAAVSMLVHRMLVLFRIRLEVVYDDESGREMREAAPC